VSVRVLGLPRGDWPAARLAGADPRHLGLLVVRGVLGRELLTDGAASLELLGPGDLLRPWGDASERELPASAVRWCVLADARLAILDREAGGRLGAYPEIHAVLLERCVARARRLALMQAIAQMNRVDRRLLALLWHLAERWGRVTPAGVAVPLALSHRMLGQLVGARRPTVSTALGTLVRAGQVARGPGGTWVLTGTPPAAPDPGSEPAVSPRRPALAEAAGGYG
jgi:hypothetical protein